VSQRATSAQIERWLPDVYGAAVAASSEPAGAAEVTASLLGAAARSRAPVEPQELVKDALLGAVRSAPHPAFAAMGVQEREVVVLAQLGRCKVPEVAQALGIAPEDVRALMRSALRTPTATGVS
jgi:hypothetical protein